MTIFEFFVTYAVCWWLVLFMVLPHKADAPVKPGVGHSSGAPENPRLGKKIRWTTLLAFIPTVALYFIITAAQADAADTIYHAGSDCDPMPTYKPSADVNAKDGFGMGDQKVKPATMDGQNFLGDKDKFDIPLQIPSQNYLNPADHNGDLSQSFIGVGTVSVSKDGSTTLNGKSISGQDTYSKDCAEKAKKKPTEADMLKTK